MTTIDALSPSRGDGPSRRGPDAVVAAGGIVLGRDSHQGKIAVVRRARYAGEVALPKGKNQDGEAFDRTALREVHEETGLDATVIGYAGSTHYFVGRVPKVVFYYLMEATGEAQPEDTGEIRSVEWMVPEAAVAALTHGEDCDLIAAVFGTARRSRK